MPPPTSREVLLSVASGQRPRQLRLTLHAQATLAEVERAVLSQVTAVARKEGDPGLLTAAEYLPLEFLDTTFDEWCELTTAMLPRLPSTVRMRTATVSGGLLSCSPSLDTSPSGQQHADAGAAGGGAARHQSQIMGAGGAGAGVSRTLLQALAEEDLTALPLAAIWLEERLKVCVHGPTFLLESRMGRTIPRPLRHTGFYSCETKKVACPSWPCLSPT